MADEFTTRRLQDLIEHYLETRSRRHDFVSTQAAHRALSQIMPSHGIPDRVLDDMIAGQAIAHGLSVYFDRERQPAPRKEPGSGIALTGSL
jgi:hypothetical protein